jgi:hypothetical protein
MVKPREQSMKRLLIQILVIFLAGISFAAEISETEVINFLGDWFDAQNTGSFSKYAAMYSKSFVGIRKSGKSTRNFDYDTWLKDRKRMFRKKMVVTSNVPKINISGTTATVRFEQTWESGAYKDKGEKLLNLALENDKLKITREEMLFSRIEVSSNLDHGDNISTFTSIKDKDCKKIKSNSMIEFFGSEYVFECPSLKGWRLFKEYDSEGIRSWIRLSYGNAIWSSINQVWGDERYNFGHFPNIDNKYVEWRISKTGEAKALIFRVNAQDPENVSSFLTRLFVISISNNIPSFCGIAKTNKEAREIADKATKCTIELEKKSLPKRERY